MKRTRARALISGGLAAAGLTTALAAAPAYAEEYGTDDPGGAPASRTDVSALEVDHTADDVFVVTRFPDLRRNSIASLTVFLDTDGDKAAEYVLGTGLGDATDYSMAAARRWKPTGEPLECDYQVRVRWKADLAKARIDRGCLADPDQVRVSVKMIDHLDATQELIDWAPGMRAWTPVLAAG